MSPLSHEQGRPHLHCSSNRTLTAVAVPWTSFGDGSFSVAEQRLWNGLLANLRQMIIYGQFRRRLKAHALIQDL